jgi:hypothetical protein
MTRMRLCQIKKAAGVLPAAFRVNKKRTVGFLELPTILWFSSVFAGRAGYPVGLARQHHEQRLRFMRKGLGFIFFPSWCSAYRF